MNRMKRLSSGILSVAAAVAVGLQSVPMTNAETLPVQAKNLVALGDSITFGYNLSDTNGNSIPSQSAFPNLIGQDNHETVSNLGVPGWTSGDLLSAVSTPAFIRTLRGASVVTIDIGSNDLLQTASALGFFSASALTTPIQLTPSDIQAFQAAMVQFSVNLSMTVTKVREYTNAPIVLYNLYNPIPDSIALNPITEQFESNFNAVISYLASVTDNTVVADAHSAFNHEQMIDVRVAEGDVHPTNVGQSVLAKAGETAMATLQQKIVATSSTVTTLLAGDVISQGGSVTGTLNHSQISLLFPKGALSHESEVDVTSQGGAAFTSLLPKNTKFVTEANFNLQKGVTLQSNATFMLKNSGITTKDSVYTVTNHGLSLYHGANISTGQVTLTTSAPQDFVVLAKISTPPEKKKH